MKPEEPKLDWVKFLVLTMMGFTAAAWTVTTFVPEGYALFSTVAIAVLTGAFAYWHWQDHKSEFGSKKSDEAKSSESERNP